MSDIFSIENYEILTKTLPYQLWSNNIGVYFRVDFSKKFFNISFYSTDNPACAEFILTPNRLSVTYFKSITDETYIESNVTIKQAQEILFKLFS